MLVASGRGTGHLDRIPLLACHNAWDLRDRVGQWENVRVEDVRGGGPCLVAAPERGRQAVRRHMRGEREIMWVGCGVDGMGVKPAGGGTLYKSATIWSALRWMMSPTAITS